MSGDFNWQTDEDVVWDEATSPPAVQPQTTHFHRKIWLLAGMIILIGGASWLIYRQAQTQLQTTQTAIREDILITQDLVQQANEAQDTELLRSLLSGRDPDWVAGQKALVAEGQLFDRSGLGLHDQGQPQVVDVEIEADLTAAALVMEREYAVQMGPGVTETITLQQTAVYRYSVNGRWLLSPPLADFWGEEGRYRGDWVSATYPRRDEELVVRFMSDLDDVLTQLCTAAYDLQCPPNLRIQVHFRTDPQEIVALLDPTDRFGGRFRVDLPTPSLVGVPIDAVASGLLYRGYAVHVVTAVISELVGYACCEQILLYQAMVDKQLSQLGLRAWPLQTADYDALLYANVGMQHLRPAWEHGLDESDWQPGYILVDFLLDQSVSLAEMQRQLRQYTAYPAWLLAVTDTSLFDLERRLVPFVAQQITAVETPPPVSLPQQDIVFICDNEIQQVDLASRELTAVPYEKLNPRTGLNLWSVSDEVYLVEEQGEGFRVTLYRQGDLQTVFQALVEENRYFFISTYADPNGRYVAVGQPGETDEQPGIVDWTWFLLDLYDCDEGECSQQSVIGWPQWSPDGAYTLVPDFNFTAPPPWVQPVYLGDASGQNLSLLPEGENYFWVNETTYGYTHLLNEQQELVTQDINGENKQVWLQEDVVRRVLQEQGFSDVRNLRMWWVVAHPTDPEVMLVTIGFRADNADQFFYFLLSPDAPDGSLVLRPLHESKVLFKPAFSPDGRLFLLIESVEGGRYLWHFVDIETGRRQTMPAFLDYRYDWSADGQWLAKAYDGYLLLLAPTYGYEQMIEVAGLTANCRNATWVTPEA